jgi:cytochrome c-type biogenesis protein CcmH
MTAFWISGTVLAVVALLAVVLPLTRKSGGAAVSRRDANIAIYRDQLRELEADLAAGTLAQADYERSRGELEARLLRDVELQDPEPAKGGKALPIAAAIAIPVLAVGIYLAVGNPGSLVAPAEHLDTMVQRLEAHLREKPDDLEGWKLLGRSHGVLGRFPEAVEAYARAAALAPRDAQVLADFADVLGMARGQSLRGEPERLVQRALELDPQNLKALALAGTAAFDRRDFRAAAEYWRRMLPLLEPASADAKVVRENVEEATKLAAGTRSLKGRIELAARLKDRVKPDDVLFVFARAEKGPPMPLAAMKVRAADLPLDFVFDDSMAMAPGMTLSQFPRVVVMARLSRAGQAAAQAGDLQGASRAVANDAQAVRVVIDTVVP